MIASRIDWLKERQKGIGGSDVAAILGVSAYRTPLDVFMDKTSEITEDKSPSEAAYWGTTLEDIVAQEFSRRTGLKVQRVNQSLVSNLDRYIDVTGSDVYQWARAHIDRAVINPKIAKTVRLSKPATPCSGRGLMLTTDAILECKTANARMSPEWGASQEAEILAGDVTSEHEIPIYYETQIQWYMAITGANICYVAVLIGGQDFRMYAVKRNEEVIQAIATKCFDFWKNNVKAGVPPAPTTVEDVKKLFPTDSGEMAEATNDEAVLIGEYRNLKEQISELESQQKAVASKLICSIGDRTGLLIAGKKAATYKAQTAKRFSSADFKAADPVTYAQFTKETTTRVLRVA